MGGHWITSPEEGFDAQMQAMGVSKQQIGMMNQGMFGDGPAPATPKSPGPAPGVHDLMIQAAQQAALQGKSTAQGLGSTFAPTDGQDKLNAPTNPFTYKPGTDHMRMTTQKVAMQTAQPAYNKLAGGGMLPSDVHGKGTPTILGGGPVGPRYNFAPTGFGGMRRNTVGQPRFQFRRR